MCGTSNPDHPAGVEMPGWEFPPAKSDEFKFRQTEAGLEREMEGNMYKQGYPLVKDTETLSILCRQAVDIVDISNDHWLMDKLQEQTNIVIEWNLIPAAIVSRVMHKVSTRTVIICSM